MDSPRASLSILVLSKVEIGCLSLRPFETKFLDHVLQSRDAAGGGVRPVIRYMCYFVRTNILALPILEYRD